MQGHSLSSRSGGSTQSAWLQTNDVALTVPFGEIKMHHARCACNSGLPPQFGSCSSSDLQSGAHGPMFRGIQCASRCSTANQPETVLNPGRHAASGHHGSIGGKQCCRASTIEIEGIEHSHLPECQSRLQQRWITA